jgi:hypothetical protein
MFSEKLGFRLKPSFSTRGPSPASSMQILDFGANSTLACLVLAAIFLLPAPATHGSNSHQNQGFAWGWSETDPEYSLKNILASPALGLGLVWALLRADARTEAPSILSSVNRSKIVPQSFRNLCNSLQKTLKILPRRFGNPSKISRKSYQNPSCTFWIIVPSSRHARVKFASKSRSCMGLVGDGPRVFVEKYAGFTSTTRNVR